MKLFHLVILLFSSILLLAQEDQVSITFNPTYNNENIQLGKKYPFTQDSIQFENLKFYISNIQLFQDNHFVHSFEKKYHLVDLENPKSLDITTKIKSNQAFNCIIFYIGVDSITNVSGAFGDDLDPTNGMYWTWQSGYINFKLEGTTPLCPTRNNLFQFHIGGYQHPYNTLQKVQLIVDKTSKINIQILLDKLLVTISLNETNEVMSPNKKAMELAALLPSIFQISK
jgi:hypothetical protein